MTIILLISGHQDQTDVHVFGAELPSNYQKSILNSCDDPKVSEDSKCHDETGRRLKDDE